MFPLTADDSTKDTDYVHPAEHGHSNIRTRSQNAQLAEVVVINEVDPVLAG